jgi:alanine racemase
MNKIAANYWKIKSEIGENVAIGAVVKANSYGFGAIPVSKKLYDEGCRIFFVATVEEGIEVRSVLNNDADIVLLGGILDGCQDIVLQHNLTPALNDYHQIKLWIEFSKKIGRKLKCVIQVDTGMYRNGLSRKEVEEHREDIVNNLNIFFVLSHLACADLVNHKKNKQQLDEFNEILSMFGDNVKASFSATNGIFLGNEYHFDVVRPGKALYGFAVREDKIGCMEPVMDVFSRIIQINEIKAGDSIGYGATFVAEKDMRVITAGIGYADGFMRKFYGFGHGFIEGKKISAVGRISMDYMVFDVSDVDEQHLKIGNWVALTQSPDHTLEKWALEMETLPHEVACRFGRRVKKIYIDNK